MFRDRNIPLHREKHLLFARGFLLKAPGSVAHYSTNDISIEKRIFAKPLHFALPLGIIVLCNRLAARESDFIFDTVIVAPTHTSSIQISCSIPFMLLYRCS
jgi:hypothetical protein